MYFLGVFAILLLGICPLRFTKKKRKGKVIIVIYVLSIGVFAILLLGICSLIFTKKKKKESYYSYLCTFYRCVRNPTARNLPIKVYQNKRKGKVIIVIYVLSSCVRNPTARNLPIKVYKKKEKGKLL